MVSADIRAHCPWSNWKVSYCQTTRLKTQTTQGSQSCQLDRHPAGQPNAWRQLHFNLCQKQTSICSKTQNLLNHRENRTGLKFRYFLLLSLRILKFWIWGDWANIPETHLKGQVDGKSCLVIDSFFIGYWALELYSYRSLQRRDLGGYFISLEPNSSLIKWLT